MLRTSVAGMLLGGVILGFAACGSEEAAPESTAPLFDCGSYDTVSSGGAEVSYFNDVHPIVQKHCNTSTCHGTPKSFADITEGKDLYLGQDESLGASPRAFTTDLVTVVFPSASKTSPTTKLVVPGKPGESMLVLKTDGCQNSAGIQDCSVPKGVGCGEAMPNTPQAGARDKLTAAEAELIRRWVAQGAKDN